MWVWAWLWFGSDPTPAPNPGAEPQLAYLLPIRGMSQLFSAVADGVLLCHLISLAEAEAIDARVVNLNPRNKFHVTENLNLAINAAKAIGCKVRVRLRLRLRVRPRPSASRPPPSASHPHPSSGPSPNPRPRPHAQPQP